MARKFKLGDKVRIKSCRYAKDVGLVGKVGKVIHLRSYGTYYRVEVPDVGDIAFDFLPGELEKEE